MVMKSIPFLLILLIILITSGAYTSDQELGGVEVSPYREMEEVIAILRAYGHLIDGIERTGEDFILRIRERAIYHSQGKMLSEKNLMRKDEFESIFYKYNTGPLEEIPSPTAFPGTRSNDFLNALLGDTDTEVRSSSRWIPFLDHRVFVHEICVESLQNIDAEIREVAQKNLEIRNYISGIKVIYSMKRRNIEGTDNLSYHSYGLALDLIPRSYKDKNVYWRWSAVFNKDWGKIPLSERWMPPAQIIEIFEKNGFIWGGKWYYFDNVHFEYRPEIIYLSTSSDR